VSPCSVVTAGFLHRWVRSGFIEHMSSSQRTNWFRVAPPFRSRRLTTVAELREMLEDTFLLRLSAMPEFDQAIARFL
jgi:hypothetical protein